MHKAINEASNAYLKGKPLDWITSNDLHQAFKAGVEFAQKWYSVEEELPEKGIWVFVSACNHGFIGVAMWTGVQWFGNEDVKDCSKNSQIEKWRPIELK